MNFILDFLLLAASGTACFYCWTLSKRLKSLTDTKEGIATSIASLSQSVEEMQNVIASSKETAGDQAGQLSALLAGTEEKIPELQTLLTQIKDISRQAVVDTETATLNLVETLSPHIKEARESANLLLGSLEKNPAKGSESVEEQKEPAAKVEAASVEPSLDADDQENDDLEFVVIDEAAEETGEAA